MRAFRPHGVHDALGLPPILRIASARVMPFQICRGPPGSMSPAAIRLPARPLPKATPSSAAQTTISSG